MLTLNRGTATAPNESITGGVLMDAPNQEFALAGSLEELKAKGRLVVHGGITGAAAFAALLGKPPVFW